MKKFLLLSLLILCSSFIFAQNETNIWYFGDHAGLDFNSGSPLALTDGMTDTWEGVSSISDINGSILFYTDGVNVWNRNHIVMPNGDSLDGGSSSTQSSLIAPISGTNLYYIFTAQEESSPNDNLSYSIVDLSLNGGNGDVIVKNTLLISNATEKLTSVNNSNGTGVWVMTHGNGNNGFYAFSLTGSTINTVPVISNTGQPFGLNGDNVGHMKFSTDGTKLAVAAWTSNFVELFDFNNSTGVVSNSKHLNIPIASNGVYGLEFSPSGNFLYASNVTPGNIYQWDITSNTTTTINASIQQIGNNSISYRGALQLGPDGKIYVATDNSYNLGVINNPELAGLQSNFVDNVVPLGGKRCGLGLPNFIQTYFIPTAINQLVTEDNFKIYPNPFISNVNIDFKKQNWKEVSLSVRNIFGQIVFSEVNKTSGKDFLKSVDLSFLSKGFYTIETIIDGERVVRKVMKE